jgi:hypothetical protein
MRAFVEGLARLYRSQDPPEGESFAKTAQAALQVLLEEGEPLRPRDAEGRPGGLLQLDRGTPVVIVPDLHGRMDFFLRVLAWQPTEGEMAMHMMGQGRLQLLCLGDIMHGEGHAAARWRAAEAEFKGGFRSHKYMDEEMRESLGMMGMIMETKRQFPRHFHVLKGNHENIANEEGNGNFPFRKLALESLMVFTYMQQFYGEELLATIARFEKELPLLAVGRAFLASHAEPAAFFPRERVIDYHQDAEVVTGLTWTGNDEAESGSVAEMLAYYLGEEEAAGAYYFGGHRPVEDGYQLRADGRFVQVHNPARRTIAFLPAEGELDPARDVREI